MLRLLNFIKSLFCKKEIEIAPEPSIMDIELKELRRNNFRASEFYYSETAEKHGIDNTPKDQNVLFNLMKLADNMQYLHNFIKAQYPASQVSIVITSGYRSPKVNKLVGGSPKSAHMTGLAADFITRVDKMALPLEDVAKYIVESGINFDQILIETKQGVVHFGLAQNEKKARNEVKFAWIKKGKWVTEKFEV